MPTDHSICSRRWHTFQRANVCTSLVASTRRADFDSNHRSSVMTNIIYTNQIDIKKTEWFKSKTRRALQKENVFIGHELHRRHPVTVLMHKRLHHQCPGESRHYISRQNKSDVIFYSLLVVYINIPLCIVAKMSNKLITTLLWLYIVYLLGII